MKIREIPFEELEPDRNEIYRCMGSGRYVPDMEMRLLIEDTIRHVSGFCRPLYGWSIYPLDHAGENSLEVSGLTLSTGTVISSFFRDATHCVAFVATSGVEFDTWMKQEAASGDIMREFVASNVGSEIAESAVRVMAADISRELSGRRMNTGNSYSPGYCGWHVGDQQALFSLLPPSPCGITLNQSSLMIPIKSVSGLIPAGPSVVRQAYGCAICDRTDCYKKKLT